jgi:hypothetical protein
MKEIQTTAPVFYPNHLAVKSVDGDEVRCQFSFYWESTSMFSLVSLSEVIELGGTFAKLLIDKYGGIPEPEVITELFREDEDLDYYLSDDCNQIISRAIQEKMREAIDDILW